MKVIRATTWSSTGCLRDSDRIIQIYQKDHLVKHSSALHSKPLHNLLSPSRNSLILRRRSLKGKDNPPTRGCGGTKCFVRISSLPSNGKKRTWTSRKKYFPHKKKPKWSKNSQIIFGFFSVHISLHFLNGQFSVCV